MNEWLKDMSESDLWARAVMEEEGNFWPTPIAYNYKRLYDMAKDGNVYGCLLQIRDLYEICMKIPVLSSLIYLDNKCEDALVNEKKLMESLILNPLAIGGWYELSMSIIKGHKRKKYILPDTLVSLIKGVKELYNQKISDKYDGISNWRNEAIGHGMLRQEDSENYREEFISLLKNLKDYFEKNAGYGDLYFVINNIRFCGFMGDEELGRVITYSVQQPEEKKQEKNSDNNSSDYQISMVIDGELLNVNDFLIRGFFLDSFYYRKKSIKYVDYITGRYSTADISLFGRYISELSEANIDKGFRENYVLGSEDEIYRCLNKPDKYIVPVELKKKINDFMDKNENGIITICMERGTGKTAFANSISGIYEDDDSAVIDDAIVHTYCVSATNLRGINDFFGTVNDRFQRVGNDTIRSSGKELPVISINDKNPGKSMMEFLNGYKEIYDEFFDVARLVFVVDGIDELNDETRVIAKWFSAKYRDLLENGIYIIYTTRFSDEGNLSKNSGITIDKIIEGSDLCINVHKDDPININVLEEYLKRVAGNRHFTLEDKDAIIKAADYRFLYLKILAEFGDVAALSEKAMISGYLNRLFSGYNMTNRVIAVDYLVSLAAFGQLSLKEFFNYISVDDMTYRFIGILNDLTPLLSIYGNDEGRYFRFANIEYMGYIFDTYTLELIQLGERLEKRFVILKAELFDGKIDYTEESYRAIEFMMRYMEVLVFLQSQYGLKMDESFLDSILVSYYHLNFISMMFGNYMNDRLEAFKNNAYEIFSRLTTDEMEKCNKLSFFIPSSSNTFLTDMYLSGESKLEGFLDKFEKLSSDAFLNWMSLLKHEDAQLYCNKSFRACYLKHMEAIFEIAEKNGISSEVLTLLCPDYRDGVFYTYSELLEVIYPKLTSEDDIFLAENYLAYSNFVRECYDDAELEKYTDIQADKYYRMVEEKDSLIQLDGDEVWDDVYEQFLKKSIRAKLGISGEESEQTDYDNRYSYLYNTMQQVIEEPSAEMIKDRRWFAHEMMDVLDLLRDKYIADNYEEKQGVVDIYRHYLNYIIKQIKGGILGAEYFDLSLGWMYTRVVVEILIDLLDDIYDNATDIMVDWVNTVDRTHECDTPLKYMICFYLSDRLGEEQGIEYLRKYVYGFDSAYSLSYDFQCFDASDYYDEIKGKLICSGDSIRLMELYHALGMKDRAEEVCRDIIAGNLYLITNLSDKLRMELPIKNSRFVDIRFYFYERSQKLGFGELLRDFSLGYNDIFEDVISDIRTYDRFNSPEFIICNIEFILYVLFKHRQYAAGLKALQNIENALLEKLLFAEDSIYSDLEEIKSLVISEKDFFTFLNEGTSVSQESIELLISMNKTYQMQEFYEKLQNCITDRNEYILDIENEINI